MVVQEQSTPVSTTEPQQDQCCHHREIELVQLPVSWTSRRGLHEFTLVSLKAHMGARGGDRNNNAMR